MRYHRTRQGAVAATPCRACPWGGAAGDRVHQTLTLIVRSAQGLFGFTIPGDVARLAEEPAFQQAMQKLGDVAASNTPGEFAKFIADDYEKWRWVINETSIRRE